MKAFCCLLLLCLLSQSCVNSQKEKADLLHKELETVTVSTFAFDSLLQEVYALPSHLQIPLLVKVSYRDEENLTCIKKQEKILNKALSIASKKEKKQILFRLVTIYQKMGQIDMIDASMKGVNLCDQLLDTYSLSHDEILNIKKQKFFFLNNQKTNKEGITILYDLLKEYRDRGDADGIIEVLCAIANFFVRLGDNNKALLIYKEAFALCSDKQILKYHDICLTSILQILSSLKSYSEVVTVCSKLNIDSIAERNPVIYPLLSISYLHEYQLDKARLFLIKMSEQSHAGSGVVFCCRMAETYIWEEKEDSAAIFLNKAIKQFAVTNNLHSLDKRELPLYLMYVYPSYASLLYRNGKIKQAEEAFQLVEPLMKRPVSALERMEKQIDALSRYSNFCLSTKQYKKATELLVFRDSIQKVYYENKISLDGKHWVDRFEIQELTFDNEKKQEEINNTKRISSIIATVSFILFGFTVATVCMYRYIRKQNKKLRENQAQMVLLLNPKPVVVKKREPLTPQEQLLELASKTVKSQKLFLNSKLTLDELAEILGTNRSTLSSCINQCAKCNFNKWINNYRIDYIKKRITATSNSRDLCTEAGFNSINTFTNSFKERLGCTPGEYIDRCKYETLQEDTQ